MDIFHLPDMGDIYTCSLKKKKSILVLMKPKYFTAAL